MLQGSPHSLASLSDMPEPSNEVKINISSYCPLMLARGELLLSLVLPEAHTISLAPVAHPHSFLLGHFSPCPPGGPPGAPGAISLPTCNTKLFWFWWVRSAREDRAGCSGGLAALGALDPDPPSEPTGRAGKTHHHIPTGAALLQDLGGCGAEPEEDKGLYGPTSTSHGSDTGGPTHLHTGNTCERHVVASQAICTGKKRHIAL